MSEIDREQRNPNSLPPELAELEASLAGLAPTHGINREELLFEAGRRVVQPAGRVWFWKGLSTALAMMLAVQTGLLWVPGEGTITDADPPERPAVEIEQPVPEFPAGLPDSLATVDDLQTDPVEAHYLRNRRLALARGVDAVDSSPGGSSDSSGDADSNQRVLLRELLGG